MNQYSTVEPLYPGAFPPPTPEEDDAPYPKAPLLAPARGASVFQRIQWLSPHRARACRAAEDHRNRHRRE